MTRSAIVLGALGLMVAPARGQLRIGPLNILSSTGYLRTGSAFNGIGGGAAPAHGDPAAGMNNPAALYAVRGLSFALESRWQPESDYLGLIRIGNVSSAPSFFALSFPVSSLRIQVGYARTFEDRRETHPIPITTEESPEGIGPSITFLTQTRIEGAFLAASLDVLEELSAGLTVAIDVVEHGFNSFTGFGSPQELSGQRLSTIAGVLFRPAQGLTIGATARLSTSPTVQSGRSVTYRRDAGDTLRPPNAVYLVPEYTAVSPPRLNTGFSLTILSGWTIAAGAEYVMWSVASEGASDRMNLHVGVAWDPVDVVTFHAGISSEPHPYEQYRTYFDQTFASFGLRCDLTNSVSFAVEWMSSEPLSRADAETVLGSPGKSLYQTSVAGGLTITL